jgi:hypothetical protein
MSTQLADDFFRLLQIKIELLTKLLDAIRRSEALLREDDMETFGHEMESCKDVTKMIDELEVTAVRLRQQIPDTQMGRFAKLESEIACILGQIDVAQKESNDVAQQKLHSFGQQIRTVRYAKKGIDGYASQLRKQDAFFVDEKK